MISHEYLKVRACRRRVTKSMYSRDANSTISTNSRLSDSLNLNILMDTYKYSFLYSL